MFCRLQNFFIFMLMTLPFFYFPERKPLQEKIILDEHSSRHVVQVLRMKEGEQIKLTDGKGNWMTAEIATAHKKHCAVRIMNVQFTPQSPRQVILAISLLRNPTRFEWFLEKATEIGVSEILPLICERTVKEKFRHSRMNAICISAMLQSQQCWLPVLHEPVPFEEVLKRPYTNCQKLIAHCAEGSKQSLHNLQFDTSARCLICIGPEGDFTQEEIDQALKNNFLPVRLGETRLRSETAGVVAAAWLTITD